MKLHKFLLLLFVFTSSLMFAQKTFKHTVQPGETIYAISKRYYVKERAILKLNKKVKKKKLQVNTVLTIPYSKKYLKKNKKKKSSNSISSNSKTHIVAKGETLYQISRTYNISVDELTRLNPEVASSLPVGYQLKINGTTTSSTIKPPKTSSSKKTASKTETLIKTSHRYLGTRYRTGGTTKKGFDCSGLMLVTYKGINMNLPRSSSEQAKVGKKVSKSRAQKGDLIFFATGRKNRINHVGMITQVSGKDIKFIHSSTSLGVIISSITEAYYSKRFVQVNRVL